MAGESINVRSAYVSISSAVQALDGGFSPLSSSIQASALTATEKELLMLDFRFVTSTDIPTAGTRVHLYRVPGDGTNQSPVPTATYKNHYVGSFDLINVAAEQYFLYGVQNVDPNDGWLWEADGSTVRGELSVRTRGAKAAA